MGLTDPTTGCTGKAALTAAEAERMNALPDAENEAGTDLFACEFGTHGPEVLHARAVQSQYDGTDPDAVDWFLRWNDDGHREIKVSPLCGKATGEGEATCLLIADHPGKCDHGCEENDGGTDWTLIYAHEEDEGWAWQLHQGNRLLDVTDEFAEDQVQEAQAWAAEGMSLAWELKVLSWARSESVPAGWLATVEDET